ncbi:MAG: PAS domain S-box protein [Desulfobacterales bacterium]
MSTAERTHPGEAGKGSPAEVERLVRARTVQLEDAVRDLEKEIAERQRFQTKLHQLSRVFWDAADAILIEDLSGTIVEMNREAEKSYGWSRDELIGKSVKTLLLPERYQVAWQLRQNCLDGREVRNWEGFRVDKYGRVFPTLLTAFPLTDENGRIEFVASITKDISILKKLELDLRESQGRLKEFSRKSIEALEADRKAVSRELHDSIGGNLAAIKFALESVAARVTENPVAAVSGLEKTISQLAEIIKDCKRISVSLRPEIIDDRGLLPTIDWHIRQFSQIHRRIRIIRQIDVAEQDVPELLKIVVYRVIQEALNNAGRHSGADAIFVRLKKFGNDLVAEVEDNGCGFDFKEVCRRGDGMSGFGLRSMRERVEIIGGAFCLNSLPGTGTSIRIAFPLPDPSPASS